MGIEDYYKSIDEENRLASSKTRLTEFLTTLEVVSKFLTASSKILELGAGYGKYSFHFANQGHDVLAFELLEHHIQGMKDHHSNNPKIAGSIKIKQGNAIDLSGQSSEEFDFVLNLGPLYHLVKKEEQDQCLNESLRVLKPGGHLAIAYVNKFVVIANNIKYSNDIFKNSLIDQVIDKGVTYSKDPMWASAEANFYKPEEIASLLENTGLEIVDHVATEGISVLLKEQINSLSEDDFQEWLRFHLKTCREPSIMGYSGHGLIVGRKPKP